MFTNIGSISFALLMVFVSLFKVIISEVKVSRHSFA